MSTLFVNQFFWPDEAATAQLLNDVAIAAARRGHVAVLCGPVSYASSSASTPPPGVEIRRLRAAGFGHGKLRKLLSYAGFASRAAWHAAAGPRPAVVVTMTTPPLLGLLGWVAQLRGARHYIWEMDLYPDVAVELGVFRKNGLLDRFTGFLADFPRRRADGIIALGPCMADRLRRRGLSRTPIHIVHNWADGDAIRPVPFHADGRLKVFYSGNMGLAHDFDTLLPVLTELGADPRFLFRFSGAGPRRAVVHSACAHLPNCEFSGYHGREELGAIFGANDIGLVTQLPETVGTVVPSKVYGILAAGRPVLFVGPETSTAAQLIHEHSVGWRVANGDSAALGALLCYLQANPQAVRDAGRRARLLFDTQFDHRVQVPKILDILNAARS